MFVFVKKQREMGFECVIVGLLLCLFNVLVVALEDAIAKQAMANFNKFSPVFQSFSFSLTYALFIIILFIFGVSAEAGFCPRGIPFIHQCAAIAHMPIIQILTQR